MEKSKRKAPINIGGLLRCCIESLEEDERTEGGAVHVCKYCRTAIKIVDGAWSWVRAVPIEEYNQQCCPPPKQKKPRKKIIYTIEIKSSVFDSWERFLVFTTKRSRDATLKNLQNPKTIRWRLDNFRAGRCIEEG